MQKISNNLKLFSFMAIFLLSATALAPKAEASWPDFAGNIGGQAVKGIWEEIENAIMAALKQAAIQTLTETINNLIAGTTQAGSSFINDWEDYLFKSPESNTSAYMNDFFTITTRGKSSGNYLSSCGGTSFTEWRSAGAKESVGIELDLSELQSDFEEYACDATKMFEEGTWDAFNSFMQPNNNPIAYALISESVYDEKLNKEQEAAKTQAVAYGGFKATMSDNGIVLTPGSITEAITASANTAPDDALTNATTWQELIGAVVGKVASQVVKQGIGNARQNVQNEINKGICDASNSLSDELDGLSPDGNLMSDFGIGSLGSSSSSNSCGF